MTNTKLNTSELQRLFAEENNITTQTTIAELCSMEKTSIAQLCNKLEGGKVDYSQCYIFMHGIVLAVAEYHGAEWSEFTTRDLAKTLYHEYYSLGVEGWVHFCKRLKAGYFGKVYGKFSPAMLVDYVNIYYSEWQEQHASINSSGSNRFAASYTPIAEAISSMNMLDQKQN